MKKNNLISNFHTHTYLCKHAEGKPIDYVKEAIKAGCSALGFSDHCPYPDSSWDYCRMGEYEVLSASGIPAIRAGTRTF